MQYVILNWILDSEKRNHYKGHKSQFPKRMDNNTKSECTQSHSFKIYKANIDRNKRKQTNPQSDLNTLLPIADRIRRPKNSVRI